MNRETFGQARAESEDAMYDKLANRQMIDASLTAAQEEIAGIYEYAENGAANFERDLMKLISDNKDTEYGRLYHFDKIRSVGDYRRMVPIVTYGELGPYVDRMADGCETNLITAYPVEFYSFTSGSTGKPKRIPLTQPCSTNFGELHNGLAWATTWAYHEARGDGEPVHYGRGMDTKECATVKTNDGKDAACVSAKGVLNNRASLELSQATPAEITFPAAAMESRYLRLLFCLLEEDLVYLRSNFMSGLSDHFSYLSRMWQILCDDIEQGTINPEIKCDFETRRALEAKLTPNPARADALRAEFSLGMEGIAARIWPNLYWVEAIGAATFAPFTRKVRWYLGPDIPICFYFYGASEGLVGVSLVANEEDALLIPGCGYMEFLPAEAPDTCTDTLLLNELEVGELYELVITNLNGFWRYRLGDVVRITGYVGELPTMVFSHRKNVTLNMAAEKVTELNVRQAMDDLCEQTGLYVSDWAVNPDDTQSPPAYEFYLELYEPTTPEQLVHMAELLDESLRRNNFMYRKEQDLGNLGRVTVKRQQQQTHLLWRELEVFRGASENQVKPVRILDTEIRRRFFTGLLER